MTPDQQTISHLLNDPEAPVALDWVLDMLEAHPTYILPALLFVKRNPDAADAETQERLRAMIAINCPDRTALADYVDIMAGGWANFYPQETVTEPTTEQTIDDFIQNYGLKTTPEEDALLEKLIFGAAPADYFAGTDEPYDPTDPLALPPELRQDSEESEEAVLQKEEAVLQKEEAALQEEGVAHQEEHGHEQPAPEEKEPKKAPKTAEESLLMESLAKIFIKQHRYDRAYEIISKLSLNYPEKSVYFADQLRFLRKLIINQQHLDK